MNFSKICNYLSLHILVEDEVKCQPRSMGSKPEKDISSFSLQLHRNDSQSLRSENPSRSGPKILDENYDVTVDQESLTAGRLQQISFIVPFTCCHWTFFSLISKLVYLSVRIKYQVFSICCCFLYCLGYLSVLYINCYCFAQL